ILDCFSKSMTETKAIRDFDLAPGGRYCTCLMDDGSISLYDLNRAFETEYIAQKARMKNAPELGGSHEELKSIPVKMKSVQQDSLERELKVVLQRCLESSLTEMQKDNFKSVQDSKDDGYDSDRYALLDCLFLFCS
ncbi:hypothetical protein BVRB_040340, partial [Beta vulgaris subsp. vulgaris]